MTWRQFFRSQWKPLSLIAAAAIAFTAVAYVVHESHARPTANEFCEGHGGVRFLDAGGGFYSVSAATCMDGTAGRVWLR